MNTYQKYSEKIQDLEIAIKSYLEKLNIDVLNLPIDHIGVKFTNQSHVENLLQDLLGMGAVVECSIVMKNRVFRTIKLPKDKPIMFLGKEVFGIELPDVKVGAERKRIGFEHIEFYFDKDIFTLEELEKYFLNIFPSFNSEYKYNLELPAVENQLPNPTLVFEKKDEEFEIKFHAKSIFEIVKG